MKVRKGDRVRILTGKDAGRDGTVSAAFPATNKVIVEQGANGQGVVPYLPLPEVQRRQNQTAPQN